MSSARFESDPEQNTHTAGFAERVRADQQKLTAELKPHYDFIVCGSGSSALRAASEAVRELGPAVTKSRLQAQRHLDAVRRLRGGGHRQGDHRCLYRKLKSDHSGDEVRPGWRVNE